jgi:branched-chain amino acid transport system substrate-binding protein
LVGKYEDKFGEAPIQAFHARSYDSTNMILDAIDEVVQESSDGTLLIGRRDLLDALYSTVDFDGITGLLTCNEFGDCANPIISIMRFDDLDGSVQGVFGNVIVTVDFGQQ